MTASAWFAGTVAVLCLAFAPAPAGAAVSHTFSHTIGSETSTPPNPYPVSEPNDVEIDQATRDVYVTDTGNHRVLKFDKDGNFVLMFGKGVNESTGADVCTAASGDTCKAGTSTSSPGGFKNPRYLAVDNYPGREGVLYVGDPTDAIVSKFDSEGNIVSGWGVFGQKDGADAFFLPGFKNIVGLAVGGLEGRLYVGGNTGGKNVWEYTASGTPKGPYRISCGGPWLKVDGKGRFFSAVSSNSGNCGTAGWLTGNYYEPMEITEIDELEPPSAADYFTVATDLPTRGFNFDPSGELYQAVGAGAHEPRVNHYVDCAPYDAPCALADTFGEGELTDPGGVAVDGDSHSVYVAHPEADEVVVFGDARPITTTGPATEATDTSLTLTGTIDPAGRGDVVECHFEYGFASFDHIVPCEPDPASSPPGSHLTGPTEVTAALSGFSPGTTNHFRLVAVNSAEGTGFGRDRTFQTTAAPAITGVAAENLTRTTADLKATINPIGLETHYRFEYGTTTEYGQTAPVPAGVLSAGFEPQKIEIHLEGLTPRIPYHYRLVAENTSGETTVEDHTFSFYPQSCPNANVRQQTQANYLPDCRAFELVSPGDAGGTQFFASGPASGRATSPSRFSYTGKFSTIPDSGGEPLDGNGDLYVATRTPTGWISRYVGWPSTEAAVVGGPPMGPPGSSRSYGGLVSQLAAYGGEVRGRLQAGVYTDLGMNRFLSFNVGGQSVGSSFTADLLNRTPIGSNAPRVYSAHGDLLDRWPTNLGTVGDGMYPADKEYYPHGGRLFEGEEPSPVAPGGSRALDCPMVKVNASGSQVGNNYCPGDVIPSGDFSHFAFATRWNLFALGGRLAAPGSVYDNDTGADTVSVASKTPAGEDISPEPGNLSGDVLQIPAVSADGSRILMTAGGVGPCGAETCPEPPCGAGESAVKRCPMQASHLYLRVHGITTFDVSQGYQVDFIGMTDDGRQVFFESDQQITSEDVDSSVDIYRWSEATDSISLISKADNEGNPGEPGNSDECAGGLPTRAAASTTGCGVATYDQWLRCVDPEGGNCLSDSFISSESGDVYFVSQELLEGSRGVPGQPNLYVSRNDQVQYVATLPGDPRCFTSPGLEFCLRVLRMQVSPDGEFMSFLSASKVTEYDNDGRSEMYRYRPENRELVCVSCKPSGDKPANDVGGSQNGLFMTDDGRVFFDTEEPLVHTDTNEALDVYEYVEGQPRLITLGIGETRAPAEPPIFPLGVPGLVGVSADGTDAYFATYETLTRDDNNGLFLKFYDARTGGGFSQPPPALPCEAADECHGPSAGPPPAIFDGTGPALGNGGNARAKKRKRTKQKNRARAHKKRARIKRRHRHKRSRKHRRRARTHGNRRAGK